LNDIRLEDALFNWLQIKMVCEARPLDRAALETESFFFKILTEDLGLSDVKVAAVGDDLLQIRFVRDGKEERKTFDRQMAEQLLHDINANPKFNED